MPGHGDLKFCLYGLIYQVVIMGLVLERRNEKWRSLIKRVGIGKEERYKIDEKKNIGTLDVQVFGTHESETQGIQNHNYLFKR